MFSESRRMKRNLNKITSLTGKAKDIFGVTTADAKNTRCLTLLKILKLGLGPEGAFYCGVGDYGQADDDSVIDHNSPPTSQPGLWCQWVPTEDGRGIEWNGAEKFYNYIEWLQYLISNFLSPWGYKLNGEVDWEGEDSSDLGKIIVKDNVITKKKAVITYK